MANKGTGNFRDIRRLLGLLLAGGMAGALLAGCKGNSSAAAMIERQVGPPPVLSVQWARGNVLHADPLSSDIWKNASWQSFTAPANTARTTAPCRAALLVDAGHLYVAFISEKSAGADDPAPMPGESPAAVSPPSGAGDRDCVSVFLDTTRAGDGREMVQITAPETGGGATCSWIRSASPVVAREDGSPDLTHPVYSIPDWKVDGLSCVIGAGTSDGRPVWTAVMAVPMEKLPTPLATRPAAGARWKLNLLRTTSRHGDLMQANLSPVFVGAQAVSPYRMAELDVGAP